MSEPEIEPLIALVRGRFQVLSLLFSRHSTPYLLSFPVDSNIEGLRSPEDTNVVGYQS